MIAGLPLASWVLLVAAVGLGLGLELAYLWAHRGGERRRQARGEPTGGGAPRP